MKTILSIAFLFVLNFGFSQQWRDSLEAARTAYENKEYGEALKYYESAQKNAPENIDLSDEMAQSAYKAREFKKAEDIYQQNGNKKESKLEKADNFHNLGNARMKNKDYSGAIESYKDALRLNPNDEQTRYNLSEAIRQLNNEQKQKKDNNQNDSQDQENDQNQDQPKKEGDQGDKENDEKNNQNQGDQNQEGNSDSKKQNKSNLPSKTVDRLLDKLMKEEAETKRKVSGSQGGTDTPKSGKDW